MKPGTRRVMKGLGIAAVWIVAIAVTLPLMAWNWLSFSYSSTGSLDSDTKDVLVRVFANWEGLMFSEHPHRVSVMFLGADAGDFRYFPATGEVGEWPQDTTWPTRGDTVGVLSEALILDRILIARPELDSDVADRCARDVIQMIDRAERHEYTGLDFDRIYDQIGVPDAPIPEGWEQLWVWYGGERAATRSVTGPSVLFPLVPIVVAIGATLFIVGVGRRRGPKPPPPPPSG
ncbi:MAG: hypothetical protein DHS20C14_09460 [Phycisphaeraceae bacterium]|nr:MAG: hypothetical protein DHS20C14_09460 [Phycisphaeraceae bacterium]